MTALEFPSQKDNVCQISNELSIANRINHLKKKSIVDMHALHAANFNQSVLIMGVFTSYAKCVCVRGWGESREHFDMIKRDCLHKHN